MSARQLECFVVVADTGSFAEAARRLGMAQPPLSRLIRRLESSIDAELFDRSRTPIRLSTTGRALLEPARRAVSQMQRVLEVARQSRTGDTGRLTIGFSSSAAIILLPSLLKEYRRQCPGVEVSLREMSTAAQLTAIESGELDVGIVRGPVTDERISTTSIHQEKFVAIIPADHALAREKSIALARLASEQFVLFPRSVAPELHRIIVEACHRAGFTPSIAQEAAEWHTIIGLVGIGLGVTVAPASVGRLGWSTVAPLQLTGCTAVAEFVIARSDRVSDPVAARFADIGARWSRKRARLPDR